jgi:chorismate-pyruvate lyase
MTMRLLRSLCISVAALVLGGATAADQTAAWRDSTLTRLEALALIQTLNAELLASNSATLTLERWCKAHTLAEPALIVARRIPDSEKTPTVAQRTNLQVGAEEPIRYRRVELRCGSKLLSVADNWYVPARLTAEMNHLLDTTETPFGKVVQSLHPDRHTLALRILWSPLPDGWEQASSVRRPQLAGPAHRARAKLLVPDELFEHQAVLSSDQHLPLAELHEVYQRAVLEFPEPVLGPIVK